MLMKDFIIERVCVVSHSYLNDQLGQLFTSRTFKNKKSWFVYNYEKFLPQDKNARILEVGPGFGELMDHLIDERNFNYYTAVDIDEDIVDYCNSRHHNRVKHITSLQKYFEESPSEKYDVILMFHVLEHIPKESASEIMSVLWGALSEGGILVIEVPNIANPVVGLYMFYSDYTHVNPFTSTSLSYLIKQSGFSNVMIVRPYVPPINVFRFFQRILQLMVELFFRIIYKIYLPSMKVLLSHSIGIIAKK